MSNHIRSIIEDKVAAYLTANMAGTTIHKGVTDELRSIPIVVCHASDANRPASLGAHNLGNYRVTLKVYVYSSADDETLQAHRDRVSKVHGLLSDDTALKATWTSADGVLYDIWAESDSEGMAQRRYGNVLTYTLVAAMPAV